MLTTSHETAAVAARAARPPGAAEAPPCFDLYGPIHKALRHQMADALLRVGRVDSDDSDDLARALDALHAMLAQVRCHLERDERHVHPAIEARLPGRTARIAGARRALADAIDALADEAHALRAQPGAAAAERLYRRLALFVADGFHRLHADASALGAALWEAFSDAELAVLQSALLAAIGDAERALDLRFLLPALAPRERQALVAGLQQRMAPAEMRRLLEAVQASLDAPAWAQLARALGLPPVPGLMAV